MKENKNRILGGVLTLLFHLLLLIGLYLGGFAPMLPQPEEGILVVVGDPESLFDEGRLNMQETEVVKPVETPPEPQPEPQPETTPDPRPEPEVVTQEMEEALALAQQKKKEEEVQRKREEQKKKEEALRKEQERKKLAEQKRKEEEQRRKEEEIKNQIANAFQNSNTTQTAGSSSQGTVAQGQTTGNSDVGQVNTSSAGYGSYDLGGRGIKGGLPMPKYRSNESGVVVVDITVGTDGKVINASVGRGTTTSSTTLRTSAVNAAKLALFDENKAAITQNGTITYRFDSDN